MTETCLECTKPTFSEGGRPRDKGSRLSARFVLRFARQLKPRWIILENVIQMRRWAGYQPLIEEIRNLGYGVLPQVLDAAYFGVPQTRRRLFLLCDREKTPEPIIQPVRPLRAAREILDRSGTWESRPLNTRGRALPTLERAARATTALGRGVPFLVVYYSSEGGGGWQSLDRPLRTLTTLDRFGLVTWDGDTAMLRMLQVPELKRAMGFGEGFRIEQGVRRDRIRLLVCPPVMEAIVRSVVRNEVILWPERPKYDEQLRLPLDPRSDPRATVPLVSPHHPSRDIAAPV
jgi:DNA (cytosine-5)-methyltransferase 1